MFSPGIRNPQRSVLICVAVALLSWASIAWGVVEMRAEGQETSGSGLKIGLAMLPAIIAPLMALNFWGGMRVIASIRRGGKTIARWTVSAADLAAFAASNKARNAMGSEHHNDWSPPRDLPSSGIDITFVPDAVLVGDTYFALVTMGPFRFSHVWMLSEGAPAIAFRTLLTLANRFGARTTAGELRIPVPASARPEAAKVVAHFEAVAAGKVIPNPDFYPRRMRFGLVAAPIFLALAAVGFASGPSDFSDGDISIASLMVIVGLTAGIAALILALAAWMLGRAQRRIR